MQTKNERADPGLRRRLLGRWKREARKTHIRLIDLMVALFIPGLLASALPAPGEEARMRVFIGLAAVELISLAWSAALMRAFTIEAAWQRVLVNVYGFAALLSWGCFFRLVPGAKHSMDWPLIFALSGAMVVSSVVVELRRQKRIAEEFAGRG